ncbi:MAG: cadmium-translocating P-type ATPase [Gammaproteobacteria bacterium]|nr:cadmium-translocating P-type ATPase [Gammaproteobacteria bacterium]
MNPVAAAPTLPRDNVPVRSAGRCFHCAGPLPAGETLSVVVAGVPQRVCCAGCRAVTERILAAGLGDYYRHRGAAAATPAADAGGIDFGDYDDPAFQETFVEQAADGTRSATLIIDGIACPACVWLNERQLQMLPGMLEVHVNYASHRARVRWDPGRLALSRIFAGVHALGYAVHPYSHARQESRLDDERRTLLRRLGVAGALGMQVMMLAVATYTGGFAASEQGLWTLLRWAMLILTVPVVGYSSLAFFQPAWRDLRAGRLSMDVPVSLGIVSAFAASAVATVRGVGDVYFDSVVMFAFFLLAGRLLELGARRRAGQVCENLVRLIPVKARRLTGTGDPAGEERVLAARLRSGDRVRVLAGEQIPADGEIVAGESGVDESLLTGESTPRRRRTGDQVIAGSVNVDSPIECVIHRAGQSTLLGQVVQLLDRAQAGRPRLTRLADSAAAWFVGAVLVLAALVALARLQAGDADWLAVTIAVLVVSCPCALSLATPAALSAGTNALMQGGLLTVRADAIEKLARVDTFVFDKTGTLTTGRLSLRAVETAGAVTAARARAEAAALERHANHPIATAIVAAHEGAALAAHEVRIVAGRGIEGRVGGRELALGSPRFVAAWRGVAVPPAGGDDIEVHLAARDGLRAILRLRDTVRPDAAGVIARLRGRGLRIVLLSGDQPASVAAVARALGIDDFAAGLLPADKLARVRTLQAAGARVAMVGDGVNDAPVLAGADVAIAVDSGTDIARAQADFVVLGERFTAIADGALVARRTLAVVRQNVIWAILYNLAAVPAAALGYVAPWVAALGMSLSSLVVVGNALRVLRPAAGEG